MRLLVYPTFSAIDRIYVKGIISEASKTNDIYTNLITNKYHRGDMTLLEATESVLHQYWLKAKIFHAKHDL